MEKYKKVTVAKGLIAIGNVMFANNLTYTAVMMTKQNALIVELANNGIELDVASDLITNGKLEKLIEEQINGKKD